MPDPPAYRLEKLLGDFAITDEPNAYCNRPGEMQSICSELHRHILGVFNEYGVAITTPAYEGDPEQPKVVPKDPWDSEPARR